MVEEKGDDDENLTYEILIIWASQREPKLKMPFVIYLFIFCLQSQINLVPRTGVSFGQHQDTEHGNNQHLDNLVPGAHVSFGQL